MPPLSWLFGLCAEISAAGSTALRDTTQETQPLPPSKDPWYKAPPGFESKAPGHILRIRPVPGNLTTLVGNTATAYHILYRTTNGHDEPSWAVTSLFVPASVYFSPSGKAALLSYQLAYNTANLHSSPSIALYGPLAQDIPEMKMKSSTSLISELLAQGWMVSTPDYLGPDSAFGSAVQGGHATLDSIRAVRNLAEMTGSTGISAAMWGYSGGSIATGAAAEMQAKYAPELEIAGAVLGGVVDNIAEDFHLLNESVIAATLVAYLLGVTAQAPNARAYLESKLLPDTKDEFMSVLHIDVFDSMKLFAGKNIYSYIEGGEASLYVPTLMTEYTTQTKIGTRGMPGMPMFVYKAVADQFCPTDQTDATVQKWVAGGADIRYDRNAVGEHISEIDNGRPRVMEWLWSVFHESYQPVAEGCSVRNVSIDVSAEEVQG